VTLVADQECPWRNYLPLESTTVTISDSNRRRYYRHKIAHPLEIRDERVNAPLRINATDMSGNGCYVETMMPLPVGTVLRVDFFLESERIKVTGVVRTCDPGVGNGTEFTGMPPDTKERVQAYLDSIDPPRGVSVPKPE
jgi:hypothetical protein